jgi:pimeloyl-ACP methyl ester carboxylesterase
LIVGHSWGGFVAWSLLVSAVPVRAAVVVDTMPALGATIAPEAATLSDVVARRVGALRILAPEELGRRLEPSIATMTRSAEQAQRVLEVAARSDPVTIAEAMEAAWLTDLRPALATHRGAPVRLVLPGDEHLDPGVRERKHALARAQVAGLPEHRVVEVAEAGHYVMLDRPEALVAIIHDVAEGV